jgi:phage shock protein PspC (stress-responsive transcriptional regulator)
MVAGVCAGLGGYLGLDPTVVRLAFLIAALLGYVGPLLIAYLVLFIVVPEESQPAPSSIKEE